MVILWAVFVIGALLGALVVVGARNPVHSALALVVTLVNTSALYAVLHAPFLAVAQIAVYAGAIMVVFILVTMLLRVDSAESAMRAPLRLRLGAIALALCFAIAVGTLIWRVIPASDPVQVPPEFGSTANIGGRLLGPQMLPFEIASLLLLVATIGAVFLTKRRSS